MPRKPSTYDAGLGLRQARPCRAPVDRRNSGSCGQRRLWSSAFRPDWRRVSDASVLRRWLAHAPPPETAPARWRMLVLRPSVDQLRGRRRRRQGDANDAGSERPVGSPPDDEVPASASASCLPPAWAALPARRPRICDDGPSPMLRCAPLSPAAIYHEATRSRRAKLCRAAQRLAHSCGRHRLSSRHGGRANSGSAQAVRQGQPANRRPALAALSRVATDPAT